MDEALQHLLDREAIRDVLLRYASGVDRKDLALVTSCFLPGAPYEGALGIGTARTAIESLRERLQRYESTLHVIANQLIEIAGDRASSETYAIAFHVLREPAAQMLTVAVRYLDELSRQNGEWKIARRRVTTEWTRVS
jgi:hypothetical protein